jgi:hypothetical protein
MIIKPAPFGMILIGVDATDLARLDNKTGEDVSMPSLVTEGSILQLDRDG